ncbi:MAG: 4-(cytidine 5'-diphospho)-2-C-methyl-D-erythritol kinase [Clostridia bacterium]|nr:4-(cytidine 5'-diphospho)-2-C-methyl-D-erythritol kinase [Clostridia bacterium]
MEFIELNAYAKINLTLEVLSKRSDGYHELRMVMHSVGIFDRIHIAKAPRGVISVECSAPLPEFNTAYRAAELYIKQTNCGGVRIRLTKNIPSEAGLGGGSADAAGVLHGMRLLYGGIDEKLLYEIGRQVGADVPFCLHGGCALAEGIGEKLTTLEPSRLPLLIVKGEAGVSTGALFHSLSAYDMRSDACVAGRMVKALHAGREAAANCLYNALSPAAESLVPAIAAQRERMLASGALGACMTGSGSAVFGIFENMDTAQEAQDLFSDCAFTAACFTVPNPIGIIDLG